MSSFPHLFCLLCRVRLAFLIRSHTCSAVHGVTVCLFQATVETRNTLEGENYVFLILVHKPISMPSLKYSLLLTVNII